MQLENESMYNYPVCVISITPLPFLCSHAEKKNKKNYTLLSSVPQPANKAARAALLAADV